MFLGVNNRDPGQGMKLNLRNRIFNELEAGILSGRYPTGANLTEKDLCEEFGVSRTPLREALCQLELEGLVECIPNKGAVVLGITQQDISDIYAIKITLDGLAAELAADRITTAELTELEETLNLTEFYVQKGDLDKLLALDSCFHDIICTASKNRPLRGMMSNFHKYLKMARHSSQTNPGRPNKMLAEHHAILDAIKHKDGALASRLSVEHTKQVRGNLEHMLGAEPTPAD